MDTNEPISQLEPHTLGAPTQGKPARKRRVIALVDKPREMGDRVIHGRLISLKFFRRHWLPVLAAVVMLIVYMSSRYRCLTLMEEIKRLEVRLEVVKTERVREKSQYMSRIRESSMQQRVDSLGLGLSVAEQPPFHISLEP